MVVDQRHDRPDAHAVPVRLNFQTAAKLPYALSHAGHTDAQGGAYRAAALATGKNALPCGRKMGKPRRSAPPSALHPCPRERRSLLVPSVRSLLVTAASRRGIACSSTRSRSAPEAPEASCAAIYDRVKTVAGCGEMLLWGRRDAEQQTGLRRNPRGIPRRQGSRRQSARLRVLGDG